MNPHTRRRLALLSLLVTPLIAVAQTETPAPSTEPVSSTEPVAPVVTPTPAPETAPAEIPAVPAPAAPAAPVVDLSPLPAVPAAPAPVVAPVPEKAKDTLSVDFPDEDIRNILRNVADLFELNIVMPDTLQGRTSIKLRDVTWRQIFKVVLAPVGYTFVEDGNIIKIVTNESLTQEPLNTEVYILNYARAEEIKPSLDSLVNTAAGGRVQVDKRINALIIVERPSALAKITPVLKNLDKATDQVMIETKFVETNKTNLRELGLRWTTTGGVNAGAAQASVGAGNNATPYTTLANGAAAAGTTVPTGFSYATAVMSNLEMAATLQALDNSTDSRVVSNPTIVTLNNTPAEINVGEEYPIPSYTYNQERGTFEVSGFEYKPIGVILKVTPQVNAQGFIRLGLEPEISVRGDPVSFGGVGTNAQIPIIRTRKTKTQVSMKDGHTLAIGGLIDSTSQKGETKVPVLGDMPGIGRLFRSNSTDNAKRNLLIFITSKVVSAETAPVQDVFSPAQVKDAGLRESDLPGRRSKENPFLPEEMPEMEGKTKKKK